MTERDFTQDEQQMITEARQFIAKWQQKGLPENRIHALFDEALHPSVATAGSRGGSSGQSGQQSTR